MTSEFGGLKASDLFALIEERSRIGDGADGYGFEAAGSGFSEREAVYRVIAT